MKKSYRLRRSITVIVSLAVLALVLFVDPRPLLHRLLVLSFWVYLACIAVAVVGILIAIAISWYYHRD